MLTCAVAQWIILQANKQSIVVFFVIHSVSIRICLAAILYYFIRSEPFAEMLVNLCFS